MQILCDVDDTVCPLVDRWLALYNNEYSDNLKKEDITDWNIGQFSNLQDKSQFYKYLVDPNYDLYEDIQPDPMALKYVKYLRELGHRVVFVTRADYRSRKFDWLIRHGFISDNRDYVLAEDKQLVIGDIMIDDRWDYIKNFKGKAILIDQPWNKKFEYKLRAENWNIVMKYIMEFMKKK